MEILNDFIFFVKLMYIYLFIFIHIYLIYDINCISRHLEVDFYFLGLVQLAI